jgi:hypothetical protein
MALPDPTVLTDWLPETVPRLSRMIPGANTLGVGISPKYEPISPRRPERLPSWEKKWGPAIKALEARGVPKDVWGPIAEIDLQRVNRGQTPLGGRETLLAIKAAMDRNAQVQPPNPGNLMQRFMRDMRQVVTAVPQMPAMMLNEVKEAPGAPAEAAAALATGDIERLAQTPVVRMLPGAYLAENLASGTSPLEHPGFSLLDISPFLTYGGLAKLPKVKTERAARIAKGKIFSASPMRVAISEYIRKPLIARKEARTGRPHQPLMTRLGISQQHQGELARHSAQGSRVGQMLTEDFFKQVEQIGKKRNIPETRQPILFEAAQSGRYGELTPNEVMYVTEMRDLIDGRLLEEGFRFAQETGNKKGLWKDPVTGEVYDLGRKELRKMIRERRVAERAEAKIAKLDERLYGGDPDPVTGKKTGSLHDAVQGMIHRGMGSAEFTAPSTIQRAAQGRKPVITGEIDYGLVDQAIKDLYDSGTLTPDKEFMARVALESEQVMTEITNSYGRGLAHDIKTLGDFDPATDTIRKPKGRALDPHDHLHKVENALYRKKDAVGRKVVNAMVKGRPKVAANMANRTVAKLREEIATAQDTWRRMAADPSVEPAWINIEKVAIEHMEQRLLQWEHIAGDLTAAARHISDRKLFAKKMTDYQNLSARRGELLTTQRAASATAQEILEKQVPARWQPLVQEQILPELRRRLETDMDLREKLAKTGGDEMLDAIDTIDWAELTIRVDEGFPIMLPGVPQRLLSEIARDVRSTWLELKAQGVDPVFVHSLDMDQAQRIHLPVKPLAKADRMPTQYRARTTDPKPAVKSLEIAVKHQGKEIIQRIVDQQYRDWITNESGWVKNGAALQSEYETAARNIMGSGDLPPGMTAANLVDHLMNQDWTAWDPKSLTPLSKGHLTRANLDTLYVPKWVEKAMNEMHPQSTSKVGGWLDKANNAFRVSILPLSPRWHVNNFVGGAVMLLADGGPGVLKHFAEARRMLKSNELPIEVSRGAGSIPGSDAAWAKAVGHDLGKIWNWEQHRKAQGLTERGKQAFTRGVQRSFDLGEQVDRLYRAMAYLEGKDKATRMGLGRTEARTAGIELANRILQDWDAMTPVERQVLRTAMPFYGWIKHIMRFTIDMPIDHPTRVAIWSNFARNEWEDWGTGIPERFMQMFMLGKPNEWGTIEAKSPLTGEFNPLKWQGGINLRGTNPFSDVANYMTLAGFAGQLNPVAGGFLEAAGINPSTGKAGIYNEQIYDEVLGRSVPIGAESPIPLIPGAAWAVAKNITPQLEFLGMGAGFTSNELRRLKIQDPEAYDQRILSTMGIPFVPRDVNMHREAALAEISRNQAAMEALNTALRTGDWSFGDRYPDVKRLLDILRTMPRSQMAPFLIGQTPKFKDLPQLAGR